MAIIGIFLRNEKFYVSCPYKNEQTFASCTERLGKLLKLVRAESDKELDLLVKEVLKKLYQEKLESDKEYDRQVQRLFHGLE